MKGNLVFIRHGKVDLPYPSHNEMPISVLNSLATKRLDPLSDEKFFNEHIDYFESLINEFNFSSIYRSPSNRCASLEIFIQSLHHRLYKSRVLNELSEINFNIETLLGPAKEVSLSEIGSLLFQSMLEESLGVEPIQSVIGRIDSLMLELPSDENVLILSHGYFMRVIAAYISSGYNPKLSMSEIYSIQKFDYFDGFILGSNKTLKYVRASAAS